MPTESSHLRILFELVKSDENSEWSSDLDAIFCKENMRVRPRQGHNGPHTCGFEDTSGHKRPQTWAFHATATTDQERAIVFGQSAGDPFHLRP